MVRTSTTVCAASVLVFIFVLLPIDVHGIWCFQCNSQIDEECAHIQPNETSSRFYRPCQDDATNRRRNGSNEFFCRKIVQNIYDRDGLVRVVRRCGWVMHERQSCYNFQNKGHEETVCQCFTDACNGALGLAQSSPLLLLSGVTVLIAMALTK